MFARYNTEAIRFLGPCPKCGALDSIGCAFRPRGNDISCESCHYRWDDYLPLIYYEYKNEPETLPIITIERLQNGVQLHKPRRSKIQHERLITTVLNTAVMIRFNLGVSLACEGGVKGAWRGRTEYKQRAREPIELTNNDAEIGLWDEHCFGYNPGCQSILRWYAELLYAVFMEEITLDSATFRRGELLRPQTNQLDESDVFIILYAALRQKTGSRRFAQQVFTNLSKNDKSPFTMRYVAGLSDDDITQIFVPPPLR